MITKEYAEAYAEIDEILGYLPDEYVNKIPVKLREFYKKAKDKEYVSKIDPYKTLDNQDMKHTTKVLLTIIYRPFQTFYCKEGTRGKVGETRVRNNL